VTTFFREGALLIALRDDRSVEIVRHGDEWMVVRASNRPLRDTPADEIITLRYEGREAIQAVLERAALNEEACEAGGDLA